MDGPNHENFMTMKISRPTVLDYFCLLQISALAPLGVGTKTKVIEWEGGREGGREGGEREEKEGRK